MQIGILMINHSSDEFCVHAVGLATQSDALCIVAGNMPFGLYIFFVALLVYILQDLILGRPFKRRTDIHVSNDKQLQVAERILASH